MSNINVLRLIPKYETYIEYVLNLLLKLPRVEKFNIGNEYKKDMYDMLHNILCLNNVKDLEIKKNYCYLIDSDISFQRIMIRIMFKQKYVSEKQYMIVINMLAEIGKMLGGYIRSIENSK